MLTAPTIGDGVGEDVDIIVNQGLKATLHGHQVQPQAPLLDGWENSHLRNGTVQRWCLQESRDEGAKQDLRDALDWLSQRFPTRFRWQESCQYAHYAFGDTAASDCGSSQAIACAVWMGSANGRVSINPNYTNGRPLLRRTAVAHEMQHLISLAHTGCQGVPDSEESIMSPANLATQLPCHVPPATWLNESDLRLAVQKYNLDAAPPTPTPTPAPQVKRAILKRWTLPEWAPCTPVVAGWCVDNESAVTPRGAWLQIVVIDRDGSESGPFGFTFIEP